MCERGFSFSRLFDAAVCVCAVMFTSSVVPSTTDSEAKSKETEHKFLGIINFITVLSSTVF